jgi:ribonuclease HI
MSALIKCRCGDIVKRLIVKKEGINQGRTFITCSTGNCSYFSWIDKNITMTGPSISSRISLSKEQSSLSGVKRKFSTNPPTLDSSVVVLKEGKNKSTIPTTSCPPPVTNPIPSMSSRTTYLASMLSKALFLYTDGSCLGNKNVANSMNPAAWAFAAVRIRDIDTSLTLAYDLEKILGTTSTNDFKNCYQMIAQDFLNSTNCFEIGRWSGPVYLSEIASVSSSNTTHTAPMNERSHDLGASVLSNNTAELSAIGEALLWVQQHQQSQPPGDIIVCSDSEYAAKSVTGEYNGNKNKPLIQNIRQILQETRRSLLLLQSHQSSSSHNFLSSSLSQLYFVHVRAHRGHYWNELVDSLALTTAEQVDITQIESLPTRSDTTASSTVNHIDNNNQDSNNRNHQFTNHKNKKSKTIIDCT